MPIPLLPLYWCGAVTVFFTLLLAFLSDDSTSNFHPLSWSIVAIGAVFWPVALLLSMTEKTRQSIDWAPFAMARTTPEAEQSSCR